MQEFLQAAFSPVNLPFTILLILMSLYWLAVIIGAADFDWLPDFDFDDDGGFLEPIFNMLNIGEVPVMMALSMMALSGWIFSMLSNYYLNPAQTVLLGTVFFLTNGVLAFFITMMMTRLLVKVFGPMGSENTEDQQVLYRAGTVITSRVDADFGQVEITTGGAPITVNARAVDGKVFTKGEKVLIFEEDREKGLFFVDAYGED